MFTRKLDFTTIIYFLLAAFTVPVQLFCVQPAQASSAFLFENDMLKIEQKEREKRKPVLRAMAKQQDPTRPPSVITQQLAPELKVKPEYQLTAIFTRNNQQYAVVNGNVLKTGDALADMFVGEITPDSLILKDAQTAQQVKVLELHGAINVKKQVVK